MSLLFPSHSEFALCPPTPPHHLTPSNVPPPEIASATAAPAITQYTEGRTSTADVPPAPGTVRAPIALPDSYIIFGGTFSTAGGIAANNIVRCNPSANRWSPPRDGTNRIVYALTLPPSDDPVGGGD